MKKMLSAIIALAMIISCVAIVPVSAAEVAKVRYVQDFDAMTAESFAAAEEWGLKTDASTIADASEITVATNVNAKMQGKVVKLAAGSKTLRIDFEKLGIVSGGKYVVEFDMLQETMSTTGYSNYIYFSGGDYPAGYTVAFANSANNWQLIRNKQGAGNMHKSKHYKIAMDLTSVSAAKFDYWVIDNSNNWALTYSDTVDITAFFKDFGLTFKSVDCPLYIDNFVVRTPETYVPSLPYEQNFSDFVEFGDEVTASVWNDLNCGATIANVSEITAATNVNDKMQGKVLRLAAGSKSLNINLEKLGVVSGEKYVVEFDMLQETMSTSNYSNYIYFSGGDYPAGYTIAFANSANNWQLIRNKQGAGNMHKSKHYKIAMDLTSVSAAKFDYWVIDNSNNWALTYSDTIDITAFAKDFGLAFKSVDYNLYIDNFVVRTPYVPTLPYAQDFSSSADFNNQAASGLWNDMRNGAVVADGKLKVPAGGIAGMDLTKLGLATDGTEYEISFDMSWDGWVSTSQFNRALVRFYTGTDGWFDIFGIHSYNVATKAEASLCGTWSGPVGAKGETLKFVYNPKTGAINGKIGNWANQSKTWGAGRATEVLRFHADGEDTFYIDNLSIKVAEVYVPELPVFEVGTAKVFDGANEITSFSGLKAAATKTVKVDWKNTKEDESAVIIVAYYSAGNQLLDGEISPAKDMLVEAGDGTATHTLVKAIPANAAYAKIMVWNNMTDLNPMVQEVTLNN